MKILLLVLALGAGLRAAGQTNLCKLDTTNQDTIQYMVDLVKPDPMHTGVYYIPKGQRMKDTTLKWVICKIEGTRDDTTTGSYIAINDYLVRPGDSIAVVGQLAPTPDTGYNLDDKPITYSIYSKQGGTAYKQVGQSTILNSSFRQYRFDPAGYFGVIDGQNNRYFFKPDGNKLEFEPGLPDTAILSAIYPTKTGLYCIAENIGDTANITYTLYQSDGNSKLKPNTYDKVKYLAHLRTGKFLVRSAAGLCSVFDPDTKKPSKELASCQRVGADSILLIDEKNAYFFVNGNMDTVRLCTDLNKTIRSVTYYPGKSPLLQIRYTSDTLSLCDFKGCSMGLPEEIPVFPADTLLPLFRDQDTLYCLGYTNNTNLFTVYKAQIEGSNFKHQSQLVPFTTDTADLVSPAPAVFRYDDVRSPGFLLTLRYSSGLYSAKTLWFSGDGRPPVAAFIAKEQKAIEFIPGDRFFCSSGDLEAWTAWDEAADTSVIKDKAKVFQIDRFYPITCAGYSRLYYYKYIANNLLRLGKYGISGKPLINKKRNGK